MSKVWSIALALCFLGLCQPGLCEQVPPVLDERPVQPGEWGYRPDDNTESQIDPPAFSWRPQKEVVSWELEVATDPAFQRVVYQANDIEWNVHCPSQTLGPGKFFWRYRGRTKWGMTNWSRVRGFTVAAKALDFPMPSRQELLGRIPDKHPRLFIRPEDLPKLRQAMAGQQKAVWKRLVRRCDQALRNPPPTVEPPKYPAGMERKSDEWAELWWGNREYTIRALGTSALLGFVYQVGGHRPYGELAKRILLECAQWDPLGATGFRYNDEAGMPYAYHFSRTYTFVYDLLTEEERESCRKIMTVRGNEMYHRLCPRHFWQPYNSHANRAWHFLGEVGVAFHGEIPEADDWTWFALNVFFNTYPVWCDDDGGWHEGSSYWASYMQRFTWWADVMQAAFGINAYRKPYFSKAGYYAMYLMPPYAVTGGFGDLACVRQARSNVPLMAALAVQARNPHWQWYVQTMGGPPEAREFWEFIRGIGPQVPSQPPTDLPTSRVFRGTGQAALNTTLWDARDNVQVLFKSSPFGLQSHGYDANNAFLLTAYNARLFVSSGRRDLYGSDHHVRWMWSTRSVNSVTVDGISQVSHSAATRGQITAFFTSPEIDVVEGEAGPCYEDPKADSPENRRLLDRFTRTIIFIKPDRIVIYDRLVAKKPVTFQYWLHSPERMEIGENRLTAQVDNVVCPVEFLAPNGLKIMQTDQYDPNPRLRGVSIREWHVTAETTTPSQQTEFLALFQPSRKESTPQGRSEWRSVPGGYVLNLILPDGDAAILLPRHDSDTVQAGQLQTTGRVMACRRDSQGRELRRAIVEGVHVSGP